MKTPHLPSESKAAVLTALVTLTLLSTAPVQTNRLSGNHVVVDWSDATCTLQAAPKATGIFTNVPGSAPGYTTPVGNGALFFRLAK